jgi:8-oxo-dGTP pyrophosphatase MutT (NUDIX family)
MAEVTRALAREGVLTAWRDELYPVAALPGGRPAFALERAAARYFGIVTRAVHLNGLVAAPREPAGQSGAPTAAPSRADTTRMWLARRAATKAIDPGMLDNLVAGGVRIDATVHGTLQREAWEEAGIDATRIAGAQPAGVVRICREQPDGLQREIIHVYDLHLPAGYVPAGIDGEAVGHRLVALREAAALIAKDAGPDLVTADASLVVVDCLFRHGAIAPDALRCLPLAELRWPALVPARTRG